MADNPNCGRCGMLNRNGFCALTACIYPCQTGMGGFVPKPRTNSDRIRAMSDEELAEYLFDRGNGSEYCYGICAYQEECHECHAQEFCIQQIVAWLQQEAKHADPD